jgi:hypothetical protein
MTSKNPNLRFFQQYIVDAAIVQRQWFELDFQYDNGAVPPLENADGWMFTPIVAIAPTKNLEFGGTISYIDYSLDNTIYGGDFGRGGFDGASGFGDITAWGKYRFVDSSQMFVTAGALVQIPTGSNDDGLGTGEFNWGVFGSMRVKAGPGSILGDVTFGFNHDATVLGFQVNGKTSTTLGVGYMWEAYEDWAFSGEVVAGSERYEGASSNFSVTGGVQFIGLKHMYFRGALAFGLTDGAPNYQITLGYAYAF